MEAAGYARRLDHTTQWYISRCALQGHRRLLLLHAKHWRERDGVLNFTGPAVFVFFVDWQGGIALDVNTFASLQTRKELEQHTLQYQPGLPRPVRKV